MLLGLEEQEVTRSQREALRSSEGFLDVKGIVVSEAEV